MAKTNHFLLLMWKNYLLQRRKITVTILEIGIPTLFAIILILIRQRVPSDEIPSPTHWTEFTLDLPDDIYHSQFKSPWKLSSLYYSPNTTLAREIMSATQRRLLPKITAMTGFPDEEMATDNFLQRKKDDILAVVVFTHLPSIDGEFDIEYKLRFPSLLRSAPSSVNPFANDKYWNTGLMFPLFQKIGPRQLNSTYGGPPDYRSEGFLSVQYAVDMAIVDVMSRSNESFKTDLRLQRLSYPPYLDDSFVLVIQQQFPMIIVLSFIFYSMQIVKDLVYEKEQKLKESMKLMGLSGWLHWLAWFVKYFLFMFISISIETVLFCIDTGAHGSVVGYSSSSLIFVFLLLYGVATIMFCFAVSTFFSKANSSAAVGSLIFFLSYIPYFFLQPHYDTLSWSAKIFSCLLSNVAMAFGAQVIGMFEGTGAGVQWSCINHTASVDDNFTMMHVIVMLLVDAVIYALIAWYVEAVFPGDFGIPLPWYFPVQKSYWFGMKQIRDEEEEPLSLETEPLLRGSSHQRSSVSEFLESEPRALHPGIQIKNLRKEFKSDTGTKVAVADMTLNLYEGQITALLGHNGAGKTTTMSILTGFFPPTSGTALISGYDILKDIGSVRSSLGLCPQHNILFDSLTVEEHFVFFTKLKGFPAELVSNEVEKILADVDLVEKRHKLVSTLSGGMKRKLSVGIALTGGSKVVILDEPSSGMDPNARRHLWDLLLRNRTGRTILLSTHFMDEADALGNRIAIMADGVIKCCGTPLFLKKKYGAGYHLTFVKQTNCDVQEITGVVGKYVPDAHLKSNVGSELTYILPFESKSNFERLFATLDDQKEWLQFSSYGVSVTTMEEVFLSAGESAETHTTPYSEMAPNFTDADYVENTPVSNGSLASGYRESLWELDERPKTAGFRLFRQQFQAMFMKHVLHFVRNKLLTIGQLLVPLALAIVALIVIKTTPTGDNQPLLHLNISRFVDPIVAFGIGRGSPPDTDLAAAYAEVLKSVKSLSPVNVSQLHRYDNISNPVDQYITDQGTLNLAKYNRNFLIALDFLTKNSLSSSHAVAYFSNQPFHASAVSLNAIDNAIYRQATKNSSARIVTANHPMPERAIDTMKDKISISLDGFAIALNVVYGMSFLASSFVLFLIRERSSKAKHSQFISGVDFVIFWTSTLVWDLINYLIPCIGIIIALAAFGMDQYIGNGRWADILLLFLLYGWAVLPFMYLLSFIFKVPSTGFIWLTIFNVISGVATIMAVAILSIPQLGTEDVAHVLEWIFLVLLPNYCLGQGLEDFSSNYEYIKICKPMKEICNFMPTFSCCSGCKNNCLSYNENYLGIAPNGIGRMLVFLTCQGCCYFAIVLLLESNILKRIFYFCCSRLKMGSAPVPPYEELCTTSQSEGDDDVVEERKRIHESPLSFLTTTQSIVMKDLTKRYGHFVAVDNISTAIGKRECFGLLGINGAGKTSTFQMLTGDTFISGGTAYILGHDLKKDFNKIQYEVGYCPQFDALIDQLTGRETLQMYANLRGLDKHQMVASINFLADALLLKPYMDKLVKSYSGGTKRKLSTAVALIGGPRIIFLDEPSSGMDPTARRHLWDTLSRVRDAGRTLVLTSHSMEECEALCTKIAIMVNGQFRCIGSTQHLKSKFGQGYTLMIKVKDVDESEAGSAVRQVQEFIEATFPGAILKDVHQGLLHFHITDPSLRLGQVFGTAEKMRTLFGIEDYSISQTTLEQVFINFAQSQVEPDEVRQVANTISCEHLCGCVSCCTLFHRTNIPVSPDVNC